MSSSMKRGLDLLLMFGEPGTASLTVSDAARELGVDKSVASRTLATLSQAGFVARDPADSRRFVLGPVIARLGALALESRSLANLARPHLQRLQRLTQETVSLQVRRGAHRFCIEQVESPLPIRRVVEMDTPLPLLQGSSGSVLLAFARPEDRERILDGASGAERESVRHRIDDVRRDGYGLSDGDRVTGISGISVAILDGNGEAVAALAISGPASRWTREAMMSHLAELQASGRELSMQFA